MIKYADSVEKCTPESLKGFFVGWPNPPSPEKYVELLESSDEIVLAIDDDTGKVVGFVTAISDGVLSAYIPLLEVLPEYQKQGIGRELMRRMLEKLDGLYMVDIICDKRVRPFYEKFGMKASCGMCIRRFGKQAGI
ncbi:MAG: GNAT family N-acetyltransferase [Candidatus Zixiibacteriota bacterium]|nr:MAG: GNAT family N-acetyltransferase [candidate division Zixibacteria bacterium]